MPVDLFDLKFADADVHMGSLAQVATIDALTHDNGPARNSRLLRLHNGGGVRIDCYPDRAMDLGQVEIDGIPVAWMSPTGMAHPGLYDAEGDRFLRTFGGGFLATCGLDHFGPPAEDQGRSFGQHGRVGGLPATVTCTQVDSDGLVVEGVVRQAAVHQENLELKRRIHVPLGQKSFVVTDTVTNLGHEAQPHMILYHCNFGWPLLCEDTQVQVSSSNVAPHNENAKGEPWEQLAKPKAGYQERVYLHTLKPGQARVALKNARLGLSMQMSFDSALLPGLCQWKMLGQKAYVLGLEPSNSLSLGGRAKARADGLLKFLQPQQSVTYALHFCFERMRPQG